MLAIGRTADDRAVEQQRAGRVAADRECVGAVVAEQRKRVARAAGAVLDHDVLADTAIEYVEAAIADQDVIAGTADQHVAACAADQDVVAVAALE